MKTVKGNLIHLALAGKFEVIVHGCNCFCTMGAGIARQIRDIFPEAYQADLKTKMGDKTKLGTISTAQIQRNRTCFTLVNGYTQFDFAGQGVLVDYDAVQNVFARIKKKFNGKRIGYPKLGAGLAKGDWKIISEIINRELEEEDHSVVEYTDI